MKPGNARREEIILNTFVKCHSKEDALMYAEALKKQGYRAIVRAATDPKIVDILEINEKLLENEATKLLFEIYAREVAN